MHMCNRALCLVMSVCVFMYVYVAKFKVLSLENLLLVQPTAHLSSLSAKKRCLLRQAIRLKKYGSILIMGQEKAMHSEKLYYSKPHLV